MFRLRVQLVDDILGDFDAPTVMGNDNVVALNPPSIATVLTDEEVAIGNLVASVVTVLHFGGSFAVPRSPCDRSIGQREPGQ